MTQGFRKWMSCAGDMGISCDEVSKGRVTCSHLCNGGSGHGKGLDDRGPFKEVTKRLNPVPLVGKIVLQSWMNLKSRVGKGLGDTVGTVAFCLV